MITSWENIRAGLESLERFKNSIMGYVEVGGFEGATRIIHMVPDYTLPYTQARKCFAAALENVSDVDGRVVLIEVLESLPEFESIEKQDEIHYGQYIGATMDVLEKHGEALRKLALRLRAMEPETASPKRESAKRTPGDAIVSLEYELRDDGLFLRMNAGEIVERTIRPYQGKLTKQAMLLLSLLERKGSATMVEVAQALYAEERAAGTLKGETIPSQIKSVCTAINKKLGADLVLFSRDGSTGRASLSAESIVDIAARREGQQSTYGTQKDWE